MATMVARTVLVALTMDAVLAKVLAAGVEGAPATADATTTVDNTARTSVHGQHMVSSSSTTTTTTIDNTKPRTDTDGNIVNAHQGHMTRFERNGEWRYYWVGSAWAPCEPVNGKCIDGQVCSDASRGHLPRVRTPRYAGPMPDNADPTRTVCWP